MLQSVHAVLRKCSDFAGSASRPEFWWFALMTVLAHLALNSLNIVTENGTIYLGASLSGAFGVAVLLPTLSVTVRRLRDAGRSWTEFFWLLLPIAGLIVLVVRLSEPSRHTTVLPPQVGTPTPVPTP